MKVIFLDKTFAMLYCCFINETNAKRWKRIHLIPKYKPISKPEFWLHENLEENLLKILTFELENNFKPTLLSQYSLLTVTFFSKQNNRHILSQRIWNFFLWNLVHRHAFHHQQAWAELWGWVFSSKTILSTTEYATESWHSVLVTSVLPDIG